MHRFRKSSTIWIHIVIVLVLILNFAPLLVALSNSFRSPGNIRSPFSLFSEITLISYQIAYKRLRYLLAVTNTILYTSISVFLTCIIASLAAYPIARLSTKMSNSLLLFFIAGMIVPAQLSMIPIYTVLRQVGIVDTRLAPIVMFVTAGIPFAVFLYTGFIRNSVPYELEESAFIDGAGATRRFWQIVFPLVRPATAALVVTRGILIWNDFFYPLLLISSSFRKPLPQAMLAFLGGRESPSQYNILFAACFLSLLPISVIFAFMQRNLVQGLTLGSLKG